MEIHNRTQLAALAASLAGEPYDTQVLYDRATGVYILVFPCNFYRFDLPVFTVTPDGSDGIKVVDGDGENVTIVFLKQNAQLAALEESMVCA